MSGGLKKIYNLVALFALLNVMAIGGLLAYLAGTGKLTAERVEHVAAVLRGELPTPQTAEAQEVGDAPPPTKSSDAIEREQLAEETNRIQADRRRAVLDQQAATARAALLQVTRAREALERERAEFDAQQRNRQNQEKSAGFQKELALLSNMKPKTALEYLLRKPNEEAANILLLMDTRKAKRIIEGARAPLQKQRVGELLDLLSEIAPADNELLAATRGTNPT